MQTNCVDHGFLNMDIAVAGCFWSAAKGKAAVSLFMKIIVVTRIRQKAFGSDNRGVNVRLKRTKWRDFESRINRLKHDYNGGARNLNEYCDAMTHIVRSVM